jgi:hypothetical protein
MWQERKRHEFESMTLRETGRLFVIVLSSAFIALAGYFAQSKSPEFKPDGTMIGAQNMGQVIDR